MDRGARRATVCVVARSRMTEQLTLSLTLLQTVKIIKTKENQRNYHSQRGTYRDMIECNVVSRKGSWNRKTILGKH